MFADTLTLTPNLSILLNFKTYEPCQATPPCWIFVINLLNLCIAFRSWFGYDIKQEESNQELLGVNIRGTQEI
jgi:hypothetical protein